MNHKLLHEQILKLHELVRSMAETEEERELIEKAKDAYKNINAIPDNVIQFRKQNG